MTSVFGAGMSMFTGMMGVGMSSYSAYKQAEAENYSRQWNSLMAGEQAKLASAKADIFRGLGTSEKAETILQYDALASEQRAAYSASGVNVNVGSALAMQQNTKAQGVYEGQKAQFQRDLQAWEMDMEARSHTLEAKFGMASQVNPWVPALTQAIGGTSSVYNTYSSWMR